MLIIFWDIQVPTTISFLEKRSSVSSANCCKLLRQDEKDIKNERMREESEGVISRHDNTRPHTAVQMVPTTNNLSWKLLFYLHYRLDLVPSLCHLFGPLKVFTKGTKFESDDDIKYVVNDCRRHQFKLFYTEEIQEIVCQQIGKCVAFNSVLVYFHHKIT